MRPVIITFRQLVKSVSQLHVTWCFTTAVWDISVTMNRLIFNVISIIHTCLSFSYSMTYHFLLLLGLVPERSSKMATKPAAAAESGPRNRTRLQTPVWVGRIPAAVLWSFPARFLVGGCAAHTHHPRRTEYTDIYKSAVVVNKRP